MALVIIHSFTIAFISQVAQSARRLTKISSRATVLRAAFIVKGAGAKKIQGCAKVVSSGAVRDTHITR